MISTVMSTFQSLTVHCARCHDHKFDPITQEDYYRLQAVFAGIDRADRPYDLDPQVHRLRQSLLAERRQLEERQRRVAEKVAAMSNPELKKLNERLAELNRELASLPKPGASPSNGYHSAIMPTEDVTKWVQVDLGKSGSPPLLGIMRVGIFRRCAGREPENVQSCACQMLSTEWRGARG
jgi:hypothetical protein